MSKIRRYLSVLMVVAIMITGIGLSLRASASGSWGGAFDYAIYSGNSYPAGANKTSFSVAGQNICTLSGLSNTVNGSVHGNYNINANTSSILGIGEAVGTVTGDNIQTKIPGAAYVSMPDFSVYKSQMKADAIAAGHYYSGNFTVANAGTLNLTSTVYIEGNANLSGVSFSGSGCLYAGGKITITGSETNYAANSSLCFYSGYTSASKSDMAIDFSGSAKNFTGLLYAPNGSILITGSNYTFNGCVIGRVVDISGSNKTFNWADVSESFKYACQYLMTFNANGGTGGTSASMTYGAALMAPVVSKPGYVFTGWSPSVPATVPATNTTYTAQWTAKPSVSITKLAEGFKVNIQGWVTGYKYQIWSLQEITCDLFTNNKTSQWMLSKAYLKNTSPDAIAETDGSISFIIAGFVSPDSDYTVAVRIVDTNGNFFGEIRDSYTPAEVQEVKITKLLVDGDYSKGVGVKEIDSSTPMLFTVVGNNVPNTTVTARVLETGDAIPSGTNEFLWNTSAMIPGIYTVLFTASNGTTSDTKQVSIQLYSLDIDIQYGNINSMGLSAAENNILPKTMAIDPDFTNGTFYYRVGEPGRKAIFTSGLFSPEQSIEYTFTKYGIYQVAGFVNREYEVRIGGHYDDGFVKNFTVRRSQTEPSSATLTATINEEPFSLAESVAKGTTIRFEANAQIGGIGTTHVQYSFWRYDAKGYALVKDWSGDNTLNWTPARVGNYTIEVRAKGTDAGSYEVAKSARINVTDNTDDIARDVSISINEDELNLNTRARAPITIKAVAVSSSEDLLYKFYVGDAAMGTSTLQNYSADSDCVWTPRKLGVYTISVLVKNQTSFGAYDAMQTFTITVD